MGPMSQLSVMVAGHVFTMLPAYLEAML